MTGPLSEPSAAVGPQGRISRWIMGPLGRKRSLLLVVAAALILGLAAVGVATGVIKVPSLGGQPGAEGSGPAKPVYAHLPATPASYLGVYAAGSPRTYAPLVAFGHAIGRAPNLAIYYSGWKELFQTEFAGDAAANDAIPLVQMDPNGVNLASIAAGNYDSYLTTYAQEVHDWGKNVVIGFGHEMNGNWYPWGYRSTSPAVFVAAWRHIVTLFRAEGDFNVTWLWTINIVDLKGGIPDPAPWWPGNSYVTWVGIDGYYLKPSWTFASLFGPTINAVRKLTVDPILVSETAVTPTAGQPAQITNLFAGIRSYGLLGFAWFDAEGHQDWRLSVPAAVAAFRQGARTFERSP